MKLFLFPQQLSIKAAELSTFEELFGAGRVTGFFFLDAKQPAFSPALDRRRRNDLRSLFCTRRKAVV